MSSESSDFVRYRRVARQALKERFAGRDVDQRALTEVLCEVARFLARPHSPLVWIGVGSPYFSIDELRQEVLGYMAWAETAALSTEDLSHLTLLFAPTGDLQEASFVCGWAEEYIGLSSRFDAATASSPGSGAP